MSLPLRLLLCSLLLLVAATLSAQERRFRIVEYNAENVFDTLSTTGKADAEFTPGGAYHWNSKLYWSKLSRLARTIATVGGLQPAALVALCEVENDTVLTHLTQRTALRRLGYEYVMTHSNDVRGINVALLFQPEQFALIEHDSLRIAPPTTKLRPTRDVLHAAGRLVTGDTLDIFVCHLPSRKQGTPAMRYRNLIAQEVRRHADSLMLIRQKPLIVITGDMNTLPKESLFRQHFRALLPSENPQSCDLCLLSADLHTEQGIRGTYFFQGEWNTLDHFIVSGTLMPKQTMNNANGTTDGDGRSSTVRLSQEGCRVADFDFLLERRGKGNALKPKRTFLGTHYHGGISDHLPLVLDLVLTME
ncbi:MAG: endonuclease [Alloprevotella sp.]